MYSIKFNTILNHLNGVKKNIKNENIIVNNVCTNDKKVKKGDVFVAIAGENFDGHSFAASAIENSAAFVITEKEIKNLPQIIVKNTRVALLQLASLNRSFFNGHLIGITGSAGKTTTKEMLATILNSSFKTLKTIGNLNNEIGMPKTILNLDPSFEAAVVEMGMSNLKEISILSKTCRPTIGIITNIGSSHIGFLGSKENILKAKLEILDGMKDSAPLILNADDEYLSKLEIKNKELIYCGIKNTKSKYYANNIKQTDFTTTFDLNKHGEFVTNISLPAIGDHNVLNCLLAIAAAEYCGISVKSIQEALKNFIPYGMRQNIYTKNGIIIIGDFYNANPESMTAAIKILKQINCTGRRFAVLGDMLELGAFSKKAHIQIGKLVAKSNIDFLFCLGEMSKQICISAQQTSKELKNNINIEHFKKHSDLVLKLKQTLKKNDAILLKASLKMNFDLISNSIFNWIWIY